jgi:hypothetical protein
MRNPGPSHLREAFIVPVPLEKISKFVVPPFGGKPAKAGTTNAVAALKPAH